MSTQTSPVPTTTQPQPPTSRPHSAPPFDQDRAEALAHRYLGIMNDAAIALLTSVGSQTGLFELLVERPGSTSSQLASAGGLDERYVREWLAGLTVAGIIDRDPRTGTHTLPPEHAAVLTPAAGPGNMAHLMQYVAMFGEVEQKVIRCFRTGGGLSYDDYPTFHETMAQESATVNDAALIDGILPLVNGLPDRLASGIDVADIGCGSGHALNLMAQAYPASTFVGYDFSAKAIAAARGEAGAMGLGNVRFELLDVTGLDIVEGFDAITAFDAIHDQAHPDKVLFNIRRALRPRGVFLMVDIKAASRVEENVGLPWASYLYAISLFHCMSVSLGLGGAGLGTAWGREVAERMVKEAGFGAVQVLEIDTDPFNLYYVART